MTGEDEHGVPEALPVDPDLPAEQPRALRRAWRGVRHRWDILVVISAGGAVGSGGRHAVAEVLPHQPGHLPWSTAAVNLCGGFLLGLLMVFVLDVWRPTRYVRPFLGVGVLGGFTTFSTYTVDTRVLLAAGRPGTAAIYLFGTLVTGLLAVWLGVISARAISGLGHPARAGGDVERDATRRPTMKRRRR